MDFNLFVQFSLIVSLKSPPVTDVNVIPTSLPSYLLWCEHWLRLYSLKTLEALMNINEFTKPLLPTTPTAQKSEEMKGAIVDILK